MIVDGAAGISPWSDEAPTRHLGMSNAATRVLPAQDRGRNDPTQETMVAPRAQPRSSAPRPSAPRTPRTVPARRPEPERAPVRDQQRGGGNRGNNAARRVAWVLALVLVIAVIAIVAVMALSQGSNSVVHDQQVVANGWRSAINQLQGIITKYTK